MKKLYNAINWIMSKMEQRDGAGVPFIRNHKENKKPKFN
jgi:hypothetical protein